MRRVASLAGRSLLLLAGGAAAGLVANEVRPHGLALAVAVRSQAESGTSACSGTGKRAPLQRPDLVPIDCAQALQLLGRPGIAFVDVRPGAICLGGHVTGACHVTVDTAGMAAASALGSLPRMKTVVLYGAASDGVACQPVRAAARALRDRGCNDVRILEGGFEAWVQASGPAASGPCEECGAPASSPPSLSPAAMSSLGRGT